MATFTYTRRIAFHETDAAGIVYYGNYFRLAEEAETHALASLSCPAEMLRYGYPRVHTEADYHAPLRFFDEVHVHARITRIGNSSLHWEFLIHGPSGLCAIVRSISARRHVTDGSSAPYTEEEKAILQSLL